MNSFDKSISSYLDIYERVLLEWYFCGGRAGMMKRNRDPPKVNWWFLTLRHKFVNSYFFFKDVISIANYCAD